ncbi:tetratricopeptide repeat protein [uncultured Paraglaciecola sp.]|uniref:tetratricopeptide repeat protein n=1 Tax=uncultured Paraglaciecola sp. TaxID=1765024 RepID=UPI0025943FEA|nr:tetratricopeptide repeat protein [uncultured Paraglaciecola sp.]
MTKFMSLSIATILSLPVLPAAASYLSVSQMNSNLEKCFQQTVLLHQKADVRNLTTLACTKVINNDWVTKEAESITRLNRGIIYMAQGQYNKAKSDFTHSLKLNINFYPAHVALAQLLNQEHDFVGAMHHYDKAIALDPDNTKLLRNRQLVANSILLNDKNKLTRQVSP